MFRPARDILEGMNDAQEPFRRIGLCADCRFMRKMESDRGSVFYLCQRSATDPDFPKYPRLPVLQCRGYQALSTENSNAQR